MSKPKKMEFRPNDYVVYPAHGVGQIISIEEQEIAGLTLELFVISFEKDSLFGGLMVGNKGMAKDYREPGKFVEPARPTPSGIDICAVESELEALQRGLSHA